jgi:hypothetical protein
MKIIDNFLPENYQNLLEEVLLGVDFPWYLNQSTMNGFYSGFGSHNTTEGSQFTHVFYKDNNARSQFFELMAPIGWYLMLTEGVDTTSIFRIKANLNTPINNYPKDHHYPVHVDNKTPVTTCIYYVNDADGDTIFFAHDGKTELNRVSPKKGRLVYFNGDTPHAGCPPTSSPNRCLINFNFYRRSK